MDVLTQRPRAAGRSILTAAIAVALTVASFAVWGETVAADNHVTLGIGDATVVEGNDGKRKATLAVTLSDSLEEDLFVNYTTVDVDATGGRRPDPGVDYKERDKTLKIRAGKTFRKLAIVIFDDTEVEGDEIFQVVLSSPSDPSVTITRATSTVTIIDDDPAPATPQLSIGDASVVEGNDNKRQAVLPITLSQPVAQDLFFDYTMVDVTATGASRPEPGVDYRSRSGTLKLRANKTFRNLPVVVFDDLEPEADETLQVVLSNPSVGTVGIGRSTGTVTIIDDDDDAPADVPGAPTAVTASVDAGSPADAIVSWTAPADDGGSPVTSYSIEVTTDAGANWSPAASVGGGVTSTSAPCGAPAVTCQYRVAATNAAGTGPVSDPSNAITTPDLPGAPTDVVAALGASPNEIDVSWTAPASDGGSPVTGYLVESTDNGGSTWSTVGTVPGTSATLCCFAPSTTFQFRVSAQTLVGTGPPSAPSNEVTTPDAPGSPTDVVASLGDASNEVDLTWTASGGDPIFYFIEYTDDAGANWYGVETTAGDVTAKTVCCFGPGLTLQFRVSAYTLLGFGDPSDPSNQVTTPGFTVPGAPSTVVATLDPLEPGSATVEWSPPTSDGGSPLTSFLVAVTTDAGDNWVLAAEVSPLLTEATVACGGPGTTCQYRVSAVNSAGAGPPSAPSNAVTVV